MEIMGHLIISLTGLLLHLTKKIQFSVIYSLTDPLNKYLLNIETSERMRVQWEIVAMKPFSLGT